MLEYGCVEGCLAGKDRVPSGEVTVTCPAHTMYISILPVSPPTYCALDPMRIPLQLELDHLLASHTISVDLHLSSSLSLALILLRS